MFSRVLQNARVELDVYIQQQRQGFSRSDCLVGWFVRAFMQSKSHCRSGAHGLGLLSRLAVVRTTCTCTHGARRGSLDYTIIRSDRESPCATTLIDIYPPEARLVGAILECTLNNNRKQSRMCTSTGLPPLQGRTRRCVGGRVCTKIPRLCRTHPYSTLVCSNRVRRVPKTNASRVDSVYGRSCLNVSERVGNRRLIPLFFNNPLISSARVVYS